MAWTVPIWIAALVFGTVFATAEPRRDREAKCSAEGSEAAVTNSSKHDRTGATRTIENPATRERWVVEQNSMHPEWPARLVPVPEEIAGRCLCLSLARNGAGIGRRNAASTLPVMVHSG